MCTLDEGQALKCLNLLAQCAGVLTAEVRTLTVRRDCRAAHMPNAYADMCSSSVGFLLTTPLSMQSPSVDEPRWKPVRPGPTFVDGELRVPAGYAEACDAADAKREEQGRQLDHHATLQVSMLPCEPEHRNQPLPAYADQSSSCCFCHCLLPASTKRRGRPATSCVSRRVWTAPCVCRVPELCMSWVAISTAVLTQVVQLCTTCFGWC